MRQFWLTLFGSVIGVVLGTALIIIFLVFMLGGFIGTALQSASSAPARALGQSIVLEIDLRDLRMDQANTSPFAFSAPLSTTELSMALERASTDDQVAGLFIRANTLSLPTAQAEEINGLIETFSNSGKFVIAHAQGFESPSLTGYFAVSSADEIWIQETAPFMASGLSADTLFLGGLFERFGVTPQFIQRHEFKTAVNTYTETEFTPAHREATLGWLNSMFSTAVAIMAEQRNMNAETFTERLINAPYSAEQSLQAGLVDQIGHVAEARRTSLEQAGLQAQFMDIERYHRLPQRTLTPNTAVIALVGGQGSIITGESLSQLGGGTTIGSDTLAAAIDAAASDARVQAIILRIDSPGGSAVASDQIWDAVLRARQSGKPVIASLGNTAASGGYYIASGADLIVANATTLTGSIGVFTGKFVIGDALTDLGIALEPLSVGGDFTTANSPATVWTDTQATAQSRLADDVYTDFTGRVASGRDLPLSRVDEIARGRVWTGAQALDLGLVDRLGGLNTAIAAARELAAIDADSELILRPYPTPPSTLEALENLLGTSAQSAEGLAQLHQLLQSPEVQALLEAQTLAQTSGVQLKHSDPASR